MPQCCSIIMGLNKKDQLIAFNLVVKVSSDLEHCCMEQKNKRKKQYENQKDRQWLPIARQINVKIGGNLVA